MINVQTVLKVADNSGAVFVSCIRLLNSSSRVGAGVGDTITVVVKKNIIKKNIKKSKEVKKGQVCSAIILRTIKGVKRWGNFFLRSSSNSVALINKYYLPIGSRLLGPVFREIRANLKFSKIISIAQVTL
jgi:large subunit ribosomal protein L14